jgi:hypothetical protein
VLWTLAWDVATRPQCTEAQAKEAVKQWANPAIAITKARQPEALDAAAACEARLGNFDGAVKYVERAIRYAQETRRTAEIKQLQAHLVFYRDHKAFIDTGDAPVAASAPTGVAPGRPPAPAAPANPIEVGHH